MDRPTTPGGLGPSQSPGPEDSSSDQGFGATGIFGAVKPSKPVEDAGIFRTESSRIGALETAKAQPAPEAKPLAEPVVHKVVFGAESGEPDTLERIRRTTAERASVVEKTPAAAPESASGQGSGGFTQLLRKLESESPSFDVAKAVPPPPAPEEQSGFTSLLRSLSTPEKTATPAPETVKMQPAASLIPEEPARTSTASPSGGFTELFRAMPAAGSGLGSSPSQSPSLGAAPAAAGSASPAPLQSEPGAFTKLFSNFGGGVSSSAAPPLERGQGASSGGGPGTFTRMLSLDPQAAPVEPSFRADGGPAAGSPGVGSTPGATGANRDPFAAAPLPEAPPEQTSSAGITRLIQMLDSPANTPASRVEPPPVSPPPGEPGIWTQTFASLATPKEPAAPTASTPPFSTPPVPSAPPQAPARGPVYSGIASPPAGNPPPAPRVSGPSEYTRILDASRMREMAIRGGAPLGVGNAAPAVPAQSAAPFAPPVQMPAYPVPPAMPAGMPQAGGYAPQPPQAPVYPMNYASYPGAMPAGGGGLPQAPGMYAPVPPAMPAAPQARPAKPAEPGVSKLQQYVPLLLVLIIVLLIGLLVTVIFLMKH